MFEKRRKEITARRAEIRALLAGEGAVDMDALERELDALDAEERDLDRREAATRRLNSGADLEGRSGQQGGHGDRGYGDEGGGSPTPGPVNPIAGGGEARGGLPVGVESRAAYLADLQGIPLQDVEARAQRFAEGGRMEITTDALAGPGDGYILGIVSGAPSVVGDVYDDQWQGMYLTDVFGRPIFEDVEVPDVTETFPDPENPESTISRIIIPAHTERRQKLNPDYDPAQTYVPRSDRPEWDAVGLLGKLVAVDDGTCVPNGWATVGEGGAATNSEEQTRYRVMARLDERHVRILIL